MTSAGDIQAGKIHLFPNWRFQIVKDVDIDLFWSTATFGEMEPEVVLNYLSIVNMSASSAYLMQCMNGRRRALLPGRRGVRTPTVFGHYIDGLTNFRCTDRRPAILPTEEILTGYEDTFWDRK